MLYKVGTIGRIILSVRPSENNIGLQYGRTVLYSNDGVGGYDSACLETDSLDRQDIMKKYLLVVLGAMVLAACGDNTDKIGRASTVFHMLGKNDRIEVEGFDDPDVQGVACYISYAKKGGLKETVNLEEDASDASVSCVQSAEVIRYNESAVLKPRQVFKRSASIAFKSQQIIRYYDPKRKSFAYLVYSDKIVQGSPKNSLSAISCFAHAKTDTPVPAGGAVYGACVVDAPVADGQK